MKRILNFAIAIVAALSFSACDSWLDVDEPEDIVSSLTKSVNFTAKNVVCKHFEAIYADYPTHDSFIFELTSDLVGARRDAIILDLLVPKGTEDFVGEYTVGYEGDYIALSKFNIYDPTTGIHYTAGSYYGMALNGYITDYYGFLTEGVVTITRTNEETAEAANIYTIEVDAKSLAHTVKMTYTGPIEVLISE